MKTVFAVAALLAAGLSAQEIPVAPVMTVEQSLEVVENVVRTAYLSIHGTLDGFAPSFVDLAGGELERWVPHSKVLASRLATLRRAEEQGEVVHLMPWILEQKELARRILGAHYAMGVN